MSVLVTGGAGYIGSHAVRELLDAGQEVIVLDNLENGHPEAVDSRASIIQGSTGDRRLLERIFQEFREIDAVMHFAADIEVAESVKDPHKYYLNNFVYSLNLLRVMRDAGVRKIVFSSTAAVYGTPEKTPIEEEQKRNPINPYGRSKLMTEMALEDFCRAYGIGYTILRYFNVAAAHPSGQLGEDHRPESHLIPLILTAARMQTEVKIFGTDYPTPDGTCVRDYVHVVDLVRAHLLAMNQLQAGQGEVYNLGSQHGFSVREVITTCENVTGLKIKVREVERRAGDPAILVASSRKIRMALGWTPQYPDLATIVAHAWQWHTKHPKGYIRLREDHPGL